jgi:AcrR family transcriptional regulator
VSDAPATIPALRRREILDAAAALLAERSWDGFAMRDVATRAGLSAGAVYQYFEGKREIFAALYAERLAYELDAIEAAPADLDGLARRIVEDFAEIWTQFGRHQQAWAAEGIERTPRSRSSATSPRPPPPATRHSPGPQRCGCASPCQRGRLPLL